MGSAGVILLVVVILAVAILAWGAVCRRCSILVAPVALGVAGLAAMGSYYAFTETQSMSSGMGYAVAAAELHHHGAGAQVRLGKPDLQPPKHVLHQHVFLGGDRAGVAVVVEDGLHHVELGV